MTDQSTAERLLIDTVQLCITGESLDAAPLVAAIITAASGQDNDFLIAVANTAAAYVDNMSE